MKKKTVGKIMGLLLAGVVVLGSQTEVRRRKQPYLSEDLQVEGQCPDRSIEPGRGLFI